MKKTSAAVCLAVALVACGVDDGGTEPAEGTTLVDIRDNNFSPDTVTIQVGAFVRWTNRGTQWHGVASPTFQSQNLFLNWWFEARFDDAGAFDIYCPIHLDENSEPVKEGTVIVVEQ